MQPYVIPFQSLGLKDIPEVGGKNASLGEMISNLSSSGVHVPGGFATTAQAYRDFLANDGLDKRIEQALVTLNVEDVTALAEAGRLIRNWIVEAPLPKRLEDEIRTHYAKLAAEGEGSFAVRSSATAEDLPDASFAGQQETFLNIQGIDNILHAIREVFASLYNDRAISYRVHKDFTHADVALSAGVQRMVRSDLGASGVLFTLDTESGFRDAVFVTSSFGLGEMVVQGAVNPDEFYVHKQQLAAGFPAVIRRSLGSKQQRMVFDEQRSAGRSTRIEPVPVADQQRFSLSDADVLQLARYAMSIEKHYGRPMDIEWGKDGIDGKLYILQARPETVKSNAANGGTEKYRLQQRGDVLVEGRAIGQKIGAGRVRIVASTAEMDKVQAGDVLVTDMTDPNWEPVMKKACCHHYQPRRTHLPRCHHRARTGYSRHRRLRPCHDCTAGRRNRYCFLRRRRYRFCISRQAAVRSRCPQRSRTTTYSGQADAQRGQSHAGVRIRATAVGGCGSGTSRIHHQ